MSPAVHLLPLSAASHSRLMSTHCDGHRHGQCSSLRSDHHGLILASSHDLKWHSHLDAHNHVGTGPGPTSIVIHVLATVSE